jgi:TonB family protein
MRWTAFALSCLFAGSLLADATPYSVATLVREKNEASLTEGLTAALRADVPLVRATAARVVAVRGVTALLPVLREVSATEPDAIAIREEIRALGLLGDDGDIAAALQAASRWPDGMDDALAMAVARRGAMSALGVYTAKIHATRMSNFTEFFREALWGHPELSSVAGSRLLASSDERGWRGVLDALEDSAVAMNAGVMAASLASSSEDIRSASVWFLVRAYAINPAAMQDLVKAKIAEPRTERSSHRVDFGLELLRRMLGGERKDDPRWLEYLATEEADHLLMGQTAVLQYLTDEEYRVRYNRCEVQERECAMPAKRSRLTIPSQPIAPPAFDLPDLLPPGLAEAIMAGTKCKESWLGVATAAVDSAGRLTKLDLDDVQTNRFCRDAVDTLLRLSLATNTSLRSGFTGPVLLVHPAGAALCLDEAAPQRGVASRLLRVGNAVEPPKVKKRVEPMFPESARRGMAGGRNVLVVLECVISKEGCVRNMRILSQSPYPELNGAAIMAVSQWTFTPGYSEGKPVDVLFNLTINFKTK